MKRTLSCLILTAAFGTWGFAQETTTVQVAPSDQVIYPDASQILNKTAPVADVKTDPKVQPKTEVTAPTAPLPSNRPLLASKPVPVAPAASVPVAPSPQAAVPTHGWFLRWTVSGDEDGVKAWAQTLGRPVQIAPAGANVWEVLAGPFSGDGLSAALAGQGGKAQLVRR